MLGRLPASSAKQIRGTKQARKHAKRFMVEAALNARSQEIIPQDAQLTSLSPSNKKALE